tara:strand:- start:12324 stop:13190 length:867 start_codon:yes stop_codon:yes gene_type:complete
MAKHVVLDAIARSGTTLMSALLRSQEKTIAFCPGFNEPLSCKNMGEWPHGMCRKEFVNRPELSLDLFKKESLSYINDYAQYYGLSKDSWRSIIYDASSTKDIRKNMEEAFPDVEVFCYRWNQALCYFYEWIEKGEDYLWVSMIRNPLDRAVSSMQKHGWSFEDSLNSTLSFCEKLKSVKNNEKFYLIRYESLANLPEKEMQDIYSFFSVNLSSINLNDIKGSNGEHFIPQSSTIKDTTTKKDGYLTEAEKFNGVYTNQINRHPFHEDDDVYRCFMDSLSEYEEYKVYF